MIALVPDSNGEAEVRESNDCHTPAGSPAGGRFCSDAVTRVGITSYRDATKPVPRTRVRTVLGPDLRELRAGLKAILTVRNVSVQPGTGVFEKGWEPTWIVGYRGNGAARRLIAATAKRYDQDSVLMMHAAKGTPKGSLDPAVELHFPGVVTHADRKPISDVLREVGLGGWTWGRRGANTVLRAVSVPEWSDAKNPTADHRERMDRVTTILRHAGLTFKVRVKHVRTEVIARKDYDRVIGGE